MHSFSAGILAFGLAWALSPQLDSPADREAFRRWFCYIAETSYYRQAPPVEVNDCAALVRYAYREALRRHTPEWRRLFAAPSPFHFSDVGQFSYPDTPTGARLFATAEGYAEFADALTLRQYNTHLAGRGPEATQPADLMFFYQPGQKQPFHLMIFLGPSNYGDTGNDWVVYHTGDKDGVVKKVRRIDLDRHPEARWRTRRDNPAFMGYYRFHLLEADR